MFVLSADEVYGDTDEDHRDRKMGEIDKLKWAFIEKIPKNIFNKIKRC